MREFVSHENRPVTVGGRFRSWLKKGLDLIPHRKPKTDRAPIVEPASPYQRAILHGLQSKPVYQGTASRHAVAKRRAKNKASRRSRRINRVRSGR